jgi:hypothetical protein
MTEILILPVTFIQSSGFSNSMKYFLSLFLLIVFVNSSCKKEGPTGGVVTGKYSIIVTVMHHERILKDIPVYLKYNATEFPGHDTSLYDWTKTSDLSGIVYFDKLFEGNYFLYGKGIDGGIGVEVIGGASVVVNASTTVNNEIYDTLMVTE